MDLIDRLRVLAAQAPKQLEHIKTEESTKTALVMPFINALGYNVFDPTEVTPELDADVGIKKGEKVDYAILKDGKPVILFECKWAGCDLSKEHASQLFRYFTVTQARFGILTNGIIYHFFSDMEEPNKMDAKPFFEFNLMDIKESTVDELKKFSKSTFDIEKACNTAIDLKYSNEIKRIMAEELNSPSEEIVKFFGSRIYSGKLMPSVKLRFTEVIKRALNQFVNDRINERLKIAIEQEKIVPESKDEPLPIIEKVVTTEEELEGYHIVKAVLRDTIDPKRVTIRDTASYCGVLLDDNNRKPICRLYFNTQNKAIMLFDKDRQGEKIAISEIYDINQFADRLKTMVKFYEQPKAKSEGERQEVKIAETVEVSETSKV